MSERSAVRRKKMSKARKKRMGKSSKMKGKIYERDVAKRMREILPGQPVQREWQADGREMPDVTAGRFSIECKHRRAISVPEAMAEAEAHAPDGTIPLLFAKWHGGSEVVAMRWETFESLMKLTLAEK